MKGNCAECEHYCYCCESALEEDTYPNHPCHNCNGTNFHLADHIIFCPITGKDIRASNSTE